MHDPAGMLVRQPSMRAVPAHLARGARALAARLERAGFRGWIVGGAVRDLALGREPEELDMASAATPEEAQALFEHVNLVGKAFGTLVVREEGVEVQLTSFRSDHGSADARRPDEVRYGRTLEEDSRRRDFTCNALYLDPLDDRFADPQGGLGDLAARRLRCVGEPRERFREDGLRLVRMARFAAGLELAIEAEVSAAARASVAALSGVSAERVAAELEKIFAQGGSARALEILSSCELLEPLLPGQRSLQPDDVAPREALELRLRALERLSGSLTLGTGLAVLLDPSPRDPESRPGDFDASAAVLDRLRPSRATRQEVIGLWRLEREAESLFQEAIAARSRRIRLVRDPAWPVAARLLEAWRAARGRELDPLAELELFAASLAPADLHPALFLKSEDLARAEIPRGPRWRSLLEEAETLQLDQRLRSREEAVEWLAAQARAR
jgi:poly(A) polymerase